MYFYKKIRNKIVTYFDNIKGEIIYNQRKSILEQNILYNKDKGINENKYCNHDIIVSLTTYGKRIYDVHLAIESIMGQTMKANRIILWLDYSFQNKQLPKALQKQQERGLEIKFCEDLRSYKKLIPSLQICPNDAIITIDDDLIYEFDLLENLIIPYISNPSYIYCHRFHKMRMNSDGELLPYNQWIQRCSNQEPDVLNFPTTGGGTLFPPNSLDEEVMNSKVFMDICKYADDVWFKAMSLKKGTLSKKVHSRNRYGDDFIAIPNVQDIGLFNINVLGEGLNDKQIKDVFSLYNLYKSLHDCT